MSKTGHQLVGIALAALAAAFCRHLGYGLVPGIAAASTAFAGSTAPDWMEISKAIPRPQHPGMWMRKSVIPHRTVTHWALAWAVFLVWALLSLPNVTADLVAQTWHAAAFGFALGGIGHLICDIPNPTGIPVLLPTAEARISLRWWRSGSMVEWLEILAFWALGGLAWMTIL